MKTVVTLLSILCFVAGCASVQYKESRGNGIAAGFAAYDAELHPFTSITFRRGELCIQFTKGYDSTSIIIPLEHSYPDDPGNSRSFSLLHDQKRYLAEVLEKHNISTNTVEYDGRERGCLTDAPRRVVTSRYQLSCKYRAAGELTRLTMDLFRQLKTDVDSTNVTFILQWREQQGTAH